MVQDVSQAKKKKKKKTNKFIHVYVCQKLYLTIAYVYNYAHIFYT